MGSMKKLIAAPVLAGALLLGGAPIADAHQAPSQTAPEADDDDDDGDNTGLWGLVGLLGLAGLAGLKRRDRDDHQYRPTGQTPTVTRPTPPTQTP